MADITSSKKGKNNSHYFCYNCRKSVLVKEDLTCLVCGAGFVEDICTRSSSNVSPSNIVPFNYGLPGPAQSASTSTISTLQDSSESMHVAPLQLLDEFRRITRSSSAYYRGPSDVTLGASTSSGSSRQEGGSGHRSLFEEPRRITRSSSSNGRSATSALAGASTSSAGMQNGGSPISSFRIRLSTSDNSENATDEYCCTHRLSTGSGSGGASGSGVSGAGGSGVSGASGSGVSGASGSGVSGASGSGVSSTTGSGASSSGVGSTTGSGAGSLAAEQARRSRDASGSGRSGMSLVRSAAQVLQNVRVAGNLRFRTDISSRDRARGLLLAARRLSGSGSSSGAGSSSSASGSSASAALISAGIRVGPGRTSPPYIHSLLIHEFFTVGDDEEDSSDDHDHSFGSFLRDIGGIQQVTQALEHIMDALGSPGAPPLPAAEIKSLSGIRILKEHVDGKLICTICIEAFQLEEKATELKCTHIFHKGCLSKWLKRHGSCPLCRIFVGQNRRNGEDDDQDQDDSHQPTTSLVH